MSVLRLLVLSPFAPRLDSAHGGGRLIAQVVVALASRHRVCLLCLRPDGDPPACEEVRARCELVEEFRQPGIGSTRGARLRRQVRLIAGFAGGRPMWVVDTTSHALAKRVRELAASWHPEIVQAEFHVMARYLDELPRGAGAPARVLTLHEPRAPAAADVAAAERGVRRLVARADARVWRRYDERVLGLVDRVVVFTDRDREHVTAAMPRAEVAVIPPGATIPPTPADPAGTEPAAILFIGNFMHPPNVAAARSLLEGIFPKVAGARRDARLYLVGDRVPAAIRRAAGGRVVVTGRVPDVREYLERAAVVCAPVRTGGGLRVKVAEALAAGKAIVATPRAAAGLAVTNGIEIVLAERDDELAAAILELLVDEPRRVELARRARAWAEANLRWERAVAAYEREYEELLRARRNGDDR